MALFDSAFGLIITILVVAVAGIRWRKLAGIPTVGGSDLPLLSFLGCYRFVMHGKATLQEGYERYKGKAYKVAMPDRWLVVLNGGPLVEELRNLPQEIMSFNEGANQSELVRTQFNKRLDTIVPAAYDEIALGIDEYLSSAESGWVDISALDFVRKIICRASNRIIVGEQKCRDEDWVNLNVEYTSDAMETRNVLTMLPHVVKPFVAKCLPTLSKQSKRATRHLEPMIAESRRQLDEKETPDQDTMLTWMLEDSRGRHASAYDLSMRILAINFAAIHTTSDACTVALYGIAAYPKYAEVIREEVRKVVAEHGWTKTATVEMIKLDSFVRESNRYWLSSPFGLIRLAMADYTFSDGTYIPKGTVLVASLVSTYEDEENFPSPQEFMPWRHVDEPSSKRQFTATSDTHLLFGHGKHACPGRIFASNEIKLILAYLLLGYDMRTEVEGVYPAPFVFGPQLRPSQTAKVLFRKRAD